MKALSYEDVRAAAARIEGRVRRVPVVQTDVRDASPGARMFLALEFMQHTGTFKDRGAQNFIEAHREAGRLPTAGVAIASGGNAGLACAWSAAQQGIPATVFVPTTAPAVKVARLRAYGARVEQVGTEYAQAFDACRAFAETSGALLSHAYDHPLIAAGAGTLVDEIRSQAPDLDTIVLAVGGGGLLAGVATAASHHGIRTVAVEPTHCRSLNAAIEAGRPVDVSVRSVAADALGARRVSDMAYLAAQHPLVSSILVDDEAIVGARRQLWRDHRLAVEHGAATAFAGVVDAAGYRPAPGERVCVVLCGANTDPRDVAEE